MKHFLLYLVLIINIFGKVINLGVSEEITILPDFDKLSVLVEKSFKDIGYKVKILPLPNARAINSANTGEIDGVFPIFKSKSFDNSNLFFINENIGGANFYAYAITGTKAITSWSDLKNLKVAYLLGTTYIDTQLEKIVPQTSITKPKEYDSLMKLLIANRVDAIILDKYVFDNSKYAKNSNIKAYPLESREVFVIMNKKYLNIQKKLELSIKKNKK